MTHTPGFTRMFDDAAEDGTRMTPEGMAHWLGTGPDGETCRTCIHFERNTGYWAKSNTKSPKGLKPGRCGKFKQQTQRWGPTIAHSNMACKYHETNPNPPVAIEGSKFVRYRG